MDPLEHPFHFPPTSSPTLLYNFLQVPPTLHPNIMHEMGGSTTFHSCARMIELQKQHLKLFWQHQMLQIDHLAVHKQHQLPLARIKRIMKSDGDVKMISAETPIVFSKACELFILELTIRSWLHAEECRRQTIRRCDIANAIYHAEVLDFLIDVIPPNEMKVDDGGFCGRNRDYTLYQQEVSRQFVITEQPPFTTHIISKHPLPLREKIDVQLDGQKLHFI